VSWLMIKAPDYRKSMEEIHEPELSSFDYHKGQTFASFETARWQGGSEGDTENLNVAFQAAREYAGKPEGWLVLTGGYGSGKTHLAAAIGNQLAEQGRFPVMVVTADLLDHLRAAFNPSSTASLDQRFDEVRNAPILILDDLSTQSATPWAREKLFQLINHRYEARLPTIITTALRLDDIEERIRIRLLDRRTVRLVAITAPAYPLRDGKKTARRGR
jgi:DNA replication protein DnaC